MTDDEIFFKDEVQFLGFGESDSYGAWVKLRLADPDQLSIFRGEKYGKKHGKRFACVLVEIDEDEKPKKQRLSLSQQAYLMVCNPNYYKYALKDRLTIQSRMRPGWTPNTEQGRQEYSDMHLKWYLHIESKSDLDKHHGKEYAFEELQKDYSRWFNRSVGASVNVNRL